MKKIALLLVGALLMSACGNEKKQEGSPSAQDSVAQANYDYMALAVLFSQRAAESKALYYQGYNVAKLKLEQDLKAKTAGKKAVVLDIDETALDNSPYEAQCVIGKISYPERWEEWCSMGIAKPLPGAVEFLKFAEQNGYAIFYITNRKESVKAGTIKNLAEKGFPMADTEHVLFRTDDNSKEGRRQKVLKDYQIVLLLGDNLADFVTAFDGPMDLAQREAKVDSLQAEFGNRFIVFPNPMYGDWEMALYPDAKAPYAEKDSLRKSYLKGF